MTFSASRLLKTLAFALIVGVWFWLAIMLWRTSIPSGLATGHVDVAAFLSRSELQRAQRFTLVSDLLSAMELVLALVVLGVFVRIGPRFRSESAAGPIGTGMMLAMLGVGLVWLALEPLSLVELWWLRRYGIEKTGYLKWMIGSAEELAIGCLAICLVILIVMGFARIMRARWWLAAAPAFAVLGLLFTFLSPYATTLRPLQNAKLSADAARLEKAERAGHIPVGVEDVSNTTTSPNAEAVGLGASRRIILWSTILSKPFTTRQIEVVLAHEIAHQRQNHLWKGVAWFALLTFPCGYLIALATRRRGGMETPRSVPLFLFATVALLGAITPLDNAFSRRIEAEADWIALQTTHDPQAARALFVNFVRRGDEDPSPPLWDRQLFGDHPTIAQRLGMVDAWQEFISAWIHRDA